jgi:hypothetical protein
MEKLPISIGILAWNSGQTLVDTLTTYYENGLFDTVNDVTILFQEVSETDFHIAKHFGLNYIGLQKNIGIGKGFIELTKFSKTDNILVLEHDWKLIENAESTHQRLSEGIELLNNEFHCVRYRHRKDPGYPHFSKKHAGHELDYYDAEIECTSPHLLDSVHWLNPAESFPDKIQRIGEWFTTTSRWGNWTNNPCMYKKQFYLDTVTQFTGDGIALEGNISRWWAKQTYKVAHGEGLFKHIDLIKYGR